MADALKQQVDRKYDAARWLEGALLFTIVAHVLAMLLMLLLLPGLPGGINKQLAARAAYVSAHPWVWRLGWLGWQLTAASDLLLALALLATHWIPKLPAICTLIITIAAIVPDQSGQFTWTWVGTSLARHAATSGDYRTYATFESAIFLRIGGWATFGYIAGALGWTWCFAVARVWSRALTVVSWIVWPLFAAVTAMLFLPRSISQLPQIEALVGIGNAVGFLLLLLWLVMVAELVLRRVRPDTLTGRHARFRHPSRGPLARVCDWLANSRLVRALFEFLPALAMDSDITDVIYVNYLIDAERVGQWVQEPLKLQRLGPGGRYALFTFLSFRHGHFGPRCLGPLRRLWPSPIQSNWRIHVFDPATGNRGIQFLTIAITATPIALAARLLSENVPMHVAR
jgi:hypothetical protein